RHLPDEPLAVLRDRDDGRRRPAALGVGHNDGLAAFHYPDAAICCSQVYSNCSRHRYHSSRGLRASASSLKLRHAESRSDFARCHFASLDRPSGPVRSSGCNVAPSTTFVGLGVSSSKRACDWSSRFKVERKMTSDSLMLVSLRFPFFFLPFAFFLPCLLTPISRVLRPSLPDHHHRRTQHAVVQLVAALHFRDHLSLFPFHVRDCLVEARVEGLPLRLDRLDAGVLE